MSGFPGHTTRPSGGANPAPQWKWWVPGTGINRSVITSEIQQYLGSDALVRPGKGSGENQGIDGYWISAYRNLTSAMIQDLQEQSMRYEKQKEAPARFQDSHHDPRDPRNPGLRPTPPLTHGTSVYPPPISSPYGQEAGYIPPRSGPPAGFEAPGYAGQPDPRDPYYQQGQQAPYPTHSQPGVSPNQPQYAHPHYTTGTPVSQADGGNYAYPSPPSNYPQQAYPPAQGSTPRQQQPFAPGYSGPPQPGYGYPTAPAASSNPHPAYQQSYPQSGHHTYR